MKIILTGITGNLGYEVACDLLQRGFTIFPIVRPGKNLYFPNLPVIFEKIIYNDLLSSEKIEFNGVADCIIHCAGIVHFRNAGTTNQQMIIKVIDLAQRLNIPLYFVSTAFVYKPDGQYNCFNNNYEKDKWQSEQVLINSGLPYGIFRPSILVGNSQTGRIQNFSGYYFIVKAFLLAINNSAKMALKLRFPKLSGKTNMVTIDQVAESIGRIVVQGHQKILFATNPNPPTFNWVLTKTLEFFDLSDQIEFIDCSFEEFGNLKLTDAEKDLYHLGLQFSPYWSISYDFPNSICPSNLISEEYLVKILNYFSISNQLTDLSILKRMPIQKS